MAEQGKDNFRDSIGTIETSGKRHFIHPKKPKGRFYNYRTWLSWVLLAIFFILPFVKINGEQFFLFNVVDRQFNLFGFPFFPQDFHILAIGIGVSVVFIILFTVIFGRIFCGWLCPQTIFMEMVFRKIEYIIEGDRSKQIKLEKQAWDGEKIRKKGLKYLVFAIVSFIITNTMFSYVIGSDALIQYMKDGVGMHLRSFIILLAFTAVFYFVFAWFREQACIIVCPYGRLQGVLLDNNSINVAYDYKRGEGDSGRGKFHKNENRVDQGLGDCIDCKQCVAVCPTGIDIRNGTQLECINCTACIDACDETMDRIGFDRGLIRYTSENNIEKGAKFKFGVRHKFYTAVLIALLGLLIGLIMLRGTVETVILNTPGQKFKKENDLIVNDYDYKVINKGTKTINNVTFKVLSHKGTVENTAYDMDIPVSGRGVGALKIKIKKADLSSYKETINIGVYSDDQLIEEVSVKFSGPISLGR